MIVDPQYAANDIGRFANLERLFRGGSPVSIDAGERTGPGNHSQRDREMPATPQGRRIRPGVCHVRGIGHEAVAMPVDRLDTPTVITQCLAKPADCLGQRIFMNLAPWPASLEKLLLVNRGSATSEKLGEDCPA